MADNPISTRSAQQVRHAPAHYYLRWPPPALEPYHAAAWPIILVLSAGAALLVIPQLIVLTAPSAAWSLGPFEPVWPIPILCALLGTLLVLGAVLRLAWLLSAGATAARLGYGWITFFQTTADVTRDTGFIVQGARHFGRLDATTRRSVLVLRLLTAAFYLLAALWPLAGFAVAYQLAVHELAGARLLWLVPLLPALAFTAAGLVCRTVERMRLRPAMQRAAERAAAAPELRWEIDEWNARLRDEVDAGALPAGGRAARRAFRAAGVGGVVVALLAVLPVIALATLSFLGPVMTRSALPGYGQAVTQLRLLTLFEEYRVPADPTITAGAAGDALHLLSFVGAAARQTPLLRPPVRTYPDAVVPRPGNLPAAMAGIGWGPGLLTAAAAGLTPEQREYVEVVASQPYHEEIVRFARAGAADIGGSRWTSPTPPELSAHEWPLPRYAVLRGALHAHYAQAALALADGRMEEAELAIRHVLSAGLRLTEDGVVGMDGEVGSSTANMAAHMLQEFFALSGQAAKAARLDATLRAADLARSSARPLEPGHASIATLPALVLDNALPRSLRWEVFGTLRSVEGCMTTKRALFGAEARAVDWQERARRDLVRYPSDAERFDVLAAHGHFGRPHGRRTTLERAVTAAAGRPGGIPGCSELLAALAN